MAEVIRILHAVEQHQLGQGQQLRQRLHAPGAHQRRRALAALPRPLLQGLGGEPFHPVAHFPRPPGEGRKAWVAALFRIEQNRFHRPVARHDRGLYRDDPRNPAFVHLFPPHDIQQLQPGVVFLGQAYGPIVFEQQHVLFPAVHRRPHRAAQLQVLRGYPLGQPAHIAEG